ncbi:hypothetical protein AAFF_G00095790 [Aldrovandia affinis]|uniref:Interleukin family protein n=1 Tax=Aldrovandia affinis TaxID=143900 RepID=A0AAD7RVP9_9TELE|nr:hypothetical protein AAFF_G00095790 [Aldrovandia affinis]
MKMDAVSLLCLYVFAFISAEAKPVHQTQLLGCNVRIPLHEIRQHFSGIRHHVSEGDPDIAIITNKVLTSIKPADRCCFLRELTGFYLHGVCSQWNGVIPLSARRHASPLANTFFTVNKDLQQCGCKCGGDALLEIRSIWSTFEKMERNAGVEKAISDLDILLHWIEAKL